MRVVHPICAKAFAVNFDRFKGRYGTPKGAAELAADGFVRMAVRCCALGGVACASRAPAPETARAFEASAFAASPAAAFCAVRECFARALPVIVIQRRGYRAWEAWLAHGAHVRSLAYRYGDVPPAQVVLLEKRLRAADDLPPPRAPAPAPQPACAVVPAPAGVVAASAAIRFCPGCGAVASPAVGDASAHGLRHVSLAVGDYQAEPQFRCDACGSMVERRTFANEALLIPGRGVFGVMACCNKVGDLRRARVRVDGTWTCHACN
jgi:hypothetical protein